MKMIIDTKFNVGDTVYHAESYEVYWSDPIPYIITEVVVVMNNDTTFIRYHIKRDGLSFDVTEKFLFATHEECVQWCKEHN